jgi:hypothetical protein
MIDILKALKTMEEIEAKMAELYEWLSSVFEHDDQASRLFIRLHMEENSHRSVLQYQSRIILKNPRTFRGGVSLDPAHMKAVMETIDRFRNKAAAPDLVESVQVALLFETAAERLYHDEAFLQSLDGLGAFVSRLHKGCKDHTAALKLFAMERGILDPPADFEYAIPDPAGTVPA